MTDYTTMSGAEFLRAVGDDPEQWAIAFDQRIAFMPKPPTTTEERRALWAEWFRDAIEAGRKAAISHVFHGDSDLMR